MSAIYGLGGESGSPEDQSGDRADRRPDSTADALSTLERAIRQALDMAPRDQVVKCIVNVLPTSVFVDEISRLHAGRVRKVSVSMPEELAEAVRARTGAGGFSRYVTDAVDRGDRAGSASRSSGFECGWSGASGAAYRSDVTVLACGVDTSGAQYQARRDAMLAKLAELDAEHAKALAGGGPKYVQRHRDRGKLTARERVELLIDPDSPFLELSALAGHGTGFAVGCGVSGIGVISGAECLIGASDPTVRGGATNPWSLKKSMRSMQIAIENRLPFVNLVESGGADLPTQKDIFIPGGQIFRDLTRMSAAGIPTIALVFGNSTAGGAYVPGMSDYVVMIEGRSKVFLGGPPLVKMATGEESDDESLGGASMHARRSGLADFLAADEHDALRIGRSIVARLNWRKFGAGPSRTPAEPLYDADELLGIVPEDLKVPFDPREVIARIVDASEFDEFKPLYGTSLVTGWAVLHGYPIGILANARGVLFSEESQKAAQFIQLANQIGVPLLFLQNTTGYMVGAHYEQAGIIKHGAMMINAVSNSRVPHLTIVMGASYGAGNYGMCGRAYDPRFLFSWPSAKSAVMGPAQLAGVLSIVGRQAATARGETYDEAADAGMRAAVENQIEAESQAFFLSGRLYDDGVIDPRDTRSVLGMCLSAIDGNPGSARPGDPLAVSPGQPAVPSSSRFGVFRM